MMKFDPFNWQEIAVNEQIEVPRGRLRLLASEQVRVWITSLGVEVLAEVGHRCDLTFSPSWWQGSTFRVEGPEGVRVFIDERQPVSYSPSGEVFTNADRMPHESGTILAIRAELRKHQVEQAFLRSEMRRERLDLERERKARLSEPPAPSEPSVPPAPEPEGQDDG